MWSGHRINAVCAIIMEHFNAQYLTTTLISNLRDYITYSISVVDRHCSRCETEIHFSPFVDRSPLISVHEIPTCMNVHGHYIILEQLMHKQQTVFVSVFSCKVPCLAETGSIRDDEARLGHAHECQQDCCSELDHPVQFCYSNLSSIVKPVSKRE